MRLENTTALIGGCFALIGCFLALVYSKTSGHYISIQHLGGISYLLYPLAAISITASIAGLYGKLPRVEIWQIICAIAGLTLTYLAFVAAREQIMFFIGNMSSDPFAGPASTNQPTTSLLRHGWGTVLLVGGFVLVLTDGLIHFKDRNASSIAR